ncbi:MAG: hypothetical protein K8F91_13180 [Candidatus Obscuribacterales bacterium]|nr:hypothetical protein [Candidatus Obscuribacterales bacterium]
MQREYHKWHSDTLGRDMEMLVFGHGGAKALCFPTSQGRFFDWEDRGMTEVLNEHLENGWIQLFCLDSVDAESWYNGSVHPSQRGARHLAYQQYVIDEVLPFSRQMNDNSYTIALGASFGAYHAINIALRFPEHFNRTLGMSGVYDIADWTGGYYDDGIHQGNPVELTRRMHDAPEHVKKLNDLEIIFATGESDSAYSQSLSLSQNLWDIGVWHAFRTWSGYAHDWPEWKEMILHYVGGPDSGN